MIVKAAKTLVIILVALAFGQHVLAQNAVPVRYFYDDTGRLISIADQSGNIATYNYDAVGNLLSITRTTAPANNGLAIFALSPQQGPVGISVTIRGQGFGVTVSANNVQFNGTPATVIAAAPDSLTVKVPTNATSGPVSVTTNGTTAFSATNFTVVPVTLISISVSPASATTVPGAVQQFTATGAFNDGTTKDVTASVIWNSSNAGVATMSNAAGTQGLATGAGDGLSQITARASGIIANATLTIKSLSGISITPSSISLPLGGKQQFTAIALFSDGTSSNVTSLASWNSSNSNVSTISNAAGTQGLASTLANGTTNITASFGATTSSASLSAISLNSIAVTPANQSLAKGVAQQYMAIGTFTDGSTTNLTNTVTWSSSNSSVALISNITGSRGLARTLGVGTTTITATSGNISGSTILGVAIPVPVSIAITPVSPIIVVGSTQQFQAVLTFTDGSTQVTSTASWISSALNVATVSGQGLASGLAAGETTITATSDNLSNSTTLVVASSIVTGTVTFSDGTPVPFPDVFVTQTDSQGNMQTFFTFSADQNGNYTVLDVGLGSFNVIAQDSQSGLNASTTGSLASTSAPAVVNVQLPAGGTVSGTFRDSAGNPIPNANVQVFSAGAVLAANLESPFSIFFRHINTNTDSQGHYALNRVAAGEVVAIASPPLANGTLALDSSNSAYVAATAGNLSNGQSLTLDVALPPTSTITGTVFAADGTTPVPNANIFAVENTGVAGGFADFFANFTAGNSFLSFADASGNFRIDSIPMGTVSVLAADSAFDVISGRATGTLSTSGPLILNPVIGNAVFINDDYNLTDSNGFVYSILCNGEVASNFQNSSSVPFRFASDILVNENDLFDSYFCGNGAYGTLDQNGRQLTLGPRPGGVSHLLLRVQRKIFVPTTGGFIRYVDSFTNPLDVPISTNVDVTSGLNFPAPDTVLADPQTNGNTLVVLQNSIQPLSPILGFVFSGKNPLVPANPFINLSSGFFSSFVDYQWNQGPAVPEFQGSVTIPPHQTISFMHFVIQWNSQDPAGAIAQAQALVNMTDPNEFVGLTTQEKSQVVNFNVP